MTVDVVSLTNGFGVIVEVEVTWTRTVVVPVTRRVYVVRGTTFVDVES